MAKVILQKVENKNLQTQAQQFYLQVAGNGVIDADKLADNVAKETGLSKTIVKAAYEYLGKAMMDYMETGQSVQIPNLGTFQLSVRMDAVATEAELSATNIKSAHVSLIAGKELKQALAGLTYEVRGAKTTTTGNTNSSETSDDDDTIQL